ncbi:FecR family protein [Spirosoma koreense]
MQDYRDLEPEELAADSSFQRWKLDNDPEASAFWMEWLARNPDRKMLVEKAYFLLITLSTQNEQRINNRAQLSDGEIQHEISRLYSALDAQKKPERIRWLQFSPIRYGMAASVLVVLGLFGWYLTHRTTTDQDVTYNELVAQVESPLAEVKNTTDKPMVVNLPDRSLILLYPKSRVSYPKQFLGVKREVYVTGEAFFDVTKNPSRPFYVYANSLITKVLGTSFTVQTNETAKQVKVVVKTGKVSVYAREQTSENQKEDYKLGGTVLTPNQQVVFSAEDTRLVRSLVNKPALLAKEAPNQAFTFKRTPIAEVFAALEKAYSIRIIFDEEAMKNCFLTASLADEPLFDKLDLICHTINAHYDQLDTYIVIDSKGCN